ncbi:MAG TPA: phosphotransferase, partial [Acidimicrobiales bacterium]
MSQLLRAWEREHRFYAELAEGFPIRVPRALANLADTDSGRYALVLEDLAPRRNLDQVKGASPADAALAVDVLARFHSAFYEHPSLAELDWMPDLDDPMVDSVRPMFDMGWPAFTARYGDDLPERVLRWTEAFASQVPEWLAGYRHLPRTLVHGDFRADNLFIADDGEVAVIDWQLSMKAPGGADIAYLLLTNLTPEVRRAHATELYERYLRGLDEGGAPEAARDRDAAWAGFCEGALFYCVSFAGGLLTLDPANDRGVALFDALVRRSFAAADDLDAGGVLGLG